MTEDRELESWREQWAQVPGPSADWHRRVRLQIGRQNLRFMAGNVVTAVAFVGMLIFAVFMTKQASWMGSGWATGLCVLVLVSVALRVRNLRGTWSADTQSTQGYLELWRKRVEARLRLLRTSIFVSAGWLVFCAVLTAINWPTIGRDVKARPTEWIMLLVACVVMQPVLWYGARWLKARKQRELDEVVSLLEELER